MKTPLAIVLLLGLVFALPAARAQEQGTAEEPTVLDVKSDEGKTTRYAVLTEAQLRARVQKAQAHSEPNWFFHVLPEDREEASKLRRFDATNDLRRKLEKQSAEFVNWVRNRTAAGGEGRKKERPTITISTLEFLTLCTDATSKKWTPALVKWANQAGPGAGLDSGLAAVVNRVELQKEPTEAELASAERARAVRKAYSKFCRGVADPMDLETLRAFVAAMK